MPQAVPQVPKPTGNPVTPAVSPSAANYAASQPGPLAPEHIAILNAAKLRSKKIRRAANVAVFSGSSLAFFAVITLFSALFGDIASFILGIGLAVSAYCELHGGALIRRFDPKGAQWLGWNQLSLALLIFMYAVWMLITMLVHPVSESVGATGDKNIDDLMTNINAIVSWGLYGGLAVFGLLGPGLTAWYYFSRAKYVREMLQNTPDWVIQTLNAAA